MSTSHLYSLGAGFRFGGATDNDGSPTIDPENLPIFQDYEYLYSYNDNNNVKVTNIPRQKRYEYF